MLLSYIYIYIYINIYIYIERESILYYTILIDYTIRIGSTPTILYFDLYLYSAYAAHYEMFTPVFTKKYSDTPFRIVSFSRSLFITDTHNKTFSELNRTP